MTIGSLVHEAGEMGAENYVLLRLLYPNRGNDCLKPLSPFDSTRIGFVPHAVAGADWKPQRWARYKKPGGKGLLTPSWASPRWYHRVIRTREWISSAILVLGRRHAERGRNDSAAERGEVAGTGSAARGSALPIPVPHSGLGSSGLGSAHPGAAAALPQGWWQVSGGSLGHCRICQEGPVGATRVRQTIYFFRTTEGAQGLLSPVLPSDGHFRALLSLCHHFSSLWHTSPHLLLCLSGCAPVGSLTRSSPAFEVPPSTLLYPLLKGMGEQQGTIMSALFPSLHAHR